MINQCAFQRYVLVCGRLPLKRIWKQEISHNYFWIFHTIIADEQHIQSMSHPDSKAGAEQQEEDVVAAERRPSSTDQHTTSHASSPSQTTWRRGRPFALLVLLVPPVQVIVSLGVEVKHHPSQVQRGKAETIHWRTLGGGWMAAVALWYWKQKKAGRSKYNKSIIVTINHTRD